MPAQHRDLVVIGASAGGVEALRSLVAAVPGDMTAAIAVVLHLPARGTSALPQILRRFGSLPTVTATSGMPVKPGTVHVAPPDHHLLLVGDHFALSHSPSENSHRPAINALFRSAAISMGPRVIGVLLSGVLDDGVAGLVTIKAHGGLVIVQDPADALYPGMPENALRHVTPDHVASAAGIGPLLARLTRDTDASRAPPLLRLDAAWSAETFMQAHGDVLERALWAALRSLDEKTGMADRMCRDAATRGSHRLAERYHRISDESREAADVLRRHLTAMPVKGREVSHEE